MKLLSIPVWVSDFVEIRRNGYYYVDKSGLIGELLGTTGTIVTLISRRRWFGKTHGISMLYIEQLQCIQEDGQLR